MISQPTSYATWASGPSGAITEPIQADKNQGFLPTGIARAEYFNFLHNAAGQWHQFLNQERDAPVFAEDWTSLLPGFTGYSGRLPENARWTVTSTGLAVAGPVSPQAGYARPAIDLAPGLTGGSKVTLSSTMNLVSTGVSGTVIAVSADVGVRTLSGSASAVFGVARVNSGPDVFTGVSGYNVLGYSWFRKAAGVSTWFAETATGATAATSVNTAVGVKQISAGGQELRMELCAPGSPIGAMTRFLIDGVVVATGGAFQTQGTVVAGLRVDTAGTTDLQIGRTKFDAYKSG